MTAKSPAGLVLAAGTSSRMGRDKALLDYRGRSFLETIVENLRAAGLDTITVVLGHHAEEIRRAARIEGVQVVENPDYLLGQTTSLQSGLKLLERAGASAVLLCLVDHPLVSPDVVRELCRLYLDTGAPLIVPTYRGRRGHPVLIGRTLFDELLRLRPDEGANRVLRKHYHQARWLKVEDRGVVVDVDTAEDYDRMRREF
jgi:molybdenum cofactor cytidylyltransferase